MVIKEGVNPKVFLRMKRGTSDVLTFSEGDIPVVSGQLSLAQTCPVRSPTTYTGVFGGFKQDLFIFASISIKQRFVA